MSLTPIKILKPFRLVNHEGARTLIKYSAGQIVEVHPAIVTKLVSDGLASADTSVSVARKLEVDSSFEIAISIRDYPLDTLDIDGVEHKRVLPVKHLIGTVKQHAEQWAWLPTPQAEEIVAAKAGTLIRWPLTSDDGASEERAYWHGHIDAATPYTVTTTV